MASTRISISRSTWAFLFIGLLIQIITFAILPEDKLKKLHELYTFYDWDEARCEARWMCSWNTTEQDVDEFVCGLKRVMSE